MLPKKLPKVGNLPIEPHKTVSEKVSSFFKSLKEEPEKGVDVPFSFEVRFDSPFITPGQLPNYRLFITSPKGPQRYKDTHNQSSGLGQFVIRSLKIELVRSGAYTAESHTKTFDKTYTMYDRTDLDYRIDLADLVLTPTAMSARDPQPYELEIKRQLYRKARLPDNVIPTFRICNIHMEYKLVIRLSFAETAQHWNPKKMMLSTPIRLLSGIPPPGEYIQHTQVPPLVASQFLNRYPPEIRAWYLGNASGYGTYTSDAEVAADTAEEPPRYQRFEQR